MGDCSNCALEKRIDKLEQKVDKISDKVSTAEGQYGFIMQAIGELKGQVNGIIQVPNKRWELVVSVVITAVLTSIITYFIQKG